eukprot:gene6712-9205_t
MFGAKQEDFIVGCIILILASFLSGAGGVGGGGLYIPILLLIFKFPFVPDCITLSLWTLLGNALAQSIFNSFVYVPSNSSLSLSNWEVIAVLLPLQLCGTTIGNLLSVMLPTSVLFIIALIVVFFASTSTLIKGLNKWKLEAANQTVTSVLPPNPPNVVINNAIFDNNSRHSLIEIIPQINNLEFSDSLENPLYNDNNGINSITSLYKSRSIVNPYQDMKNWPWKVILIVTAMWSIYLILSSITSTVTKICSNSFIATTVIVFIPLFVTTFWALNYYHKQTLSNEVALGFHKTNLSYYTLRNEVSFYTFIIGVVCPLIGIGGGELLCPLLIVFGVSPEISSATTTIMTCYDAIVTLVKFAILHEIQYDLSFILFFIGFITGFLGRQFSMFIATKYRRSSVITIALSISLFLSCIYFSYELATQPFITSVSKFCS